MDSIQQPTTTLQPAPTVSTKSSKNLVIIMFIITVVLLFLFGGGGYYYFEIYQPSQYVKAVIPIYDELRSQPMGGGNPTGSDDYEDILIILDQYQASLTQINVKLSKLKPSPIKTIPSFLTNAKESQQIQEDFTKILEEFISKIAKAKNQAQLMIKAKELILLLRPDLTVYPPLAVPAGQGTPSPPPPSTAGEFLTVWEERVPKAKVVAKDFFSEPQDLGDVSFDELKSLWQETEQGFDVILSFLKKQDSNLPLRDAQKLVPQNEKVLFDKVDKIDEFLPKLESVLIRNSAENILRTQFLIDDAKRSEFETRFARLDSAIRELKKKYQFFLFVPLRALAQSNVPPNASSFLHINYSYTEPSDTAREYNVYIDGKFYPEHYTSGVSEGRHHLKCSKPGYLDYETDFDFPVDSIDDKVDSVDCYFSKTALLIIKVRDNQGNKVTAKVTIDDKEEGESDESSTLVGRGLHKIICKAKGYKTFSSEITITDYAPPIVGVETPPYYSLQCVLEPLGFWGRLWDKLLTLLSNVVKR